MTDEEHRLNYLVANVFMEPEEAKEYIKNNSPMVGEQFYLLGQRCKELNQEILKLTTLCKKAGKK